MKGDVTVREVCINEYGQRAEQEHRKDIALHVNVWPNFTGVPKEREGSGEEGEERERRMRRSEREEESAGRKKEVQRCPRKRGEREEDVIQGKEVKQQKRGQERG